ncbi:MlaD family protein [Bdellovibrio sp. HCB288]|uniref:MlaD family protein n=1 Tax=Bdellovibrio sp. HCB288 TaxID=3394355 RepID=UPI0039B6463F
MESSNSTQVKVGIFIAIGVVIILGSIFFIGGEKSIFKSYVNIHAHFDQVQGLAEGSVVSLSGVTIGNVQKINFLSEKNTLDVVMRVDKTYTSRIREGSQVEIRTQGALGDKFVFIIPGDPRNPEIQDGAILEIAKPTDLIGVISERGGEAGKLFDVINEMYKITKAMNDENRLGKIMANFESTSANLSRVSGEASGLMKKLNDGHSGEKLTNTINKLDAIVSKVDRGEGTLGALINDPSIHNQLKALLGGTQRKNNVKSLLRTSIEKEE